MKKGARLNSVASLSQGLNVPVAKPTLMKVQNDICGNSKTWTPNKMVSGPKIPIRSPIKILL
ncbi:MAG TPA: hypothetical protein DCX01_03665 [Bacteroidetes bacterium]|nr:hypothetical protein [Bacteroidota bacterium]